MQMSRQHWCKTTDWSVHEAKHSEYRQGAATMAFFLRQVGMAIKSVSESFVTVRASLRNGFPGAHGSLSTE
jgi:hypothetical protein